MTCLRTTTSLLLILGCIFFPAGCRNLAGNGNGNGNDNGSGNDNTGGSDELTDAQKAAVDDAFVHLESTAMALAGIVEGLNSDAEPQGPVQIGECPEVTFETLDGLLVTLLDFGDGCTNEYFAEISASGSVRIEFDVLARTRHVEYDEFTVDGRTVSGSLDVQVVVENARRTLTGSIDVSASGVGSVSGSLEITLDLLDGVLTIVAAEWAVSDADGDEYAMEAAGVVVAPIDNGSFIPEDGSLTFNYPGEGRAPRSQTITVEFDEESPLDGTVDVTVEEQTVEYELPI